MNLRALTALYSVAIVHLILTPYTKVEESFHTQAFHDVLLGFQSPDGNDGYISSFKAYYDIYFRLFPSLEPLECSKNTTITTACIIKSSFDHLSFPGVVPRSFLPATVIATIVRPVKFALEFGENGRQLGDNWATIG